MKIGKQAKATASMIQISKVTTAGPIASPSNPDARPAAPTQPRILKMLLPITLPTAISRSPLIAAEREAATSGNEVPAATMVSPITNSLIPSSRANPVAASTSHREPKMSNANPPITSAIWTGSFPSHAVCAEGLSSLAYSSWTTEDCWRDWMTRKTVYAISRENKKALSKKETR